MNDVERSALNIYNALETELQGKSSDYAKAVISAVLAKIGRVSIKDGDERISVRSSTAIELIKKILATIDVMQEGADDRYLAETSQLREKLSGIRDTIAQTNQVTSRQQLFLMSTVRSLRKK